MEQSKELSKALSKFLYYKKISANVTNSDDLNKRLVWYSDHGYVFDLILELSFMIILRYYQNLF